MKGKALPILIIVAIGCFATLPVLVHGISLLSHDGATHSLWYTQFSQQLWSGELYPRWLPDMNNGLGSPAFFYYPPVPYFVTSLLRPLFADDPLGLRQLGLSASIAVTLSGLFAYRWLQELVDGRSALIAAVVYMITPYHIVCDLYIRYSFAELWAFVWIPLTLYFTRRTAKGDQWAPLGLAISYALLIATHLPTTLVFTPVLMTSIAVITRFHVTFRRFMLASASMAVGIGLSAIFLYPAMTMQPYVFVENMGLGRFSYVNALFVSSLLSGDEMQTRVFFILTQLTALAISLFLSTRPATPDGRYRRLAIFWFIAALSCIFMMTDLSRPLWYFITPLQKIQFPWRICVLLTMTIAPLCGLAVSLINGPRDIFESRARLVASFCLFLSFPALAWGVSLYFTPPADPGDLVFKQKVLQQKREVAEYRPRWSRSMQAVNWNVSTDEEYWSQFENEYESLIKRTGVSDATSPKAKIVSGAGQVEILHWRPRDLCLHINTDGEATVQLSHYYFPSWRAISLDDGKEMPVQPSIPDGLIELHAPRGEHQISMQLTRTPEERIGQTASFISALCLASYALWVTFVTGKTNKV